MKAKILFLVLSFINVNFVQAQMDEMFYYPSKILHPIEWNNYEETEFAVEEDSISVLILKPSEKARATIFYFHGTSGNNTYYFPLVLPMLKNNYQVVMIDFRGYGKSSGIPTHKNIATDAQIVFDHLSNKEGIIDKPKILYGASIGSQIATHLAKNNQNQIKALILEGGMSSFGDIAAYYTPEYKEFLEQNYVSPYSAKEDIKSLDKIPKLIIHSIEDKDVPFEQGKTVFKNASEDKVFLEFSGEHLRAMKYESVKIFNEIDKMLEKQIDLKLKDE